MRNILALEPAPSTLAEAEIPDPTPDDDMGQTAVPPQTQTQTQTTRTDATYPSSSSGDMDLEKQQDPSDEIIPDRVDVQYAERQFADLKRRYSNLSRVTSGSSQRSRPVLVESEKGPAEGQWQEDTEESDDEFDLEDVLRDRHRKEVEHDIKPKHLGLLSLMCNDVDRDQALSSRI
jgi:hypothetical protein